jgi:hypothetical protein
MALDLRLTQEVVEVGISLLPDVRLTQEVVEVGIGVGDISAVGTASGSGTASGVGSAGASSVGTASGSSTATGVGAARGPSRVSQFVEEFADGKGVGARVTTHAVEYANGKPADARVTAFAIEVIYRTSSITPVTPPFPGWGTCPPEDPTVVAGRGDGQDAGFAWGCADLPASANPTPGHGDGKSSEDLPFKWGNC